MSYEGFDEYICLQGHYWAVDAYFVDDVPKCPRCKCSPRYFHMVDETNGRYEDEPGTFPAATEEIGFEDDWRKDHYGNKYSVRIPLVKPAANSAWKQSNRS